MESKSKNDTKKVNTWLVHVSKFREKHPKLSYKEVLQEEKKTYKKKAVKKKAEKKKGGSKPEKKDKPEKKPRKKTVQVEHKNEIKMKEV